jgi:hypothetical protein
MSEATIAGISGAAGGIFALLATYPLMTISTLQATRGKIDASSEQEVQKRKAGTLSELAEVGVFVVHVTVLGQCMHAEQQREYQSEVRHLNVGEALKASATVQMWSWSKVELVQRRMSLTAAGCAVGGVARPVQRSAACAGRHHGLAGHLLLPVLGAATGSAGPAAPTAWPGKG